MNWRYLVVFIGQMPLRKRKNFSFARLNSPIIKPAKFMHVFLSSFRVIVNSLFPISVNFARKRK
jgi:hypothetical protein